MRLALGAVATAASCLAPSGALALETAREIQDCVRRNLESKTSVQTITLDAKDRVGGINRLHAKIYYKKDEGGSMRVLLQIDEPQDLREAAILLVEREGSQDIFMYVPELRRTRRLHGRMVTDTMFGTDFSYEDFRRMEAMAEDLVGQRLADAEVQGRPVYVVSATPPPSEDSIYRRVVSYVDQKTCVPLKLELFQKEKDESPRKILEADAAQISEHKGLHVARRLVLRDLREGTETAIAVEELEVDVEIPEKLFKERTLDQQR
jgi:hypothetical protein